MKITEPIQYNVCSDCHGVTIHDFGGGSGGAIESICHHHGADQGVRRYQYIVAAIEREHESAADGMAAPAFYWDSQPPKPRTMEVPLAPIDDNPKEWERYLAELDAHIEYARNVMDWCSQIYNGPESSFSWSSCELCRSSLGGNRWDVYLYVRDNG